MNRVVWASRHLTSGAQSARFLLPSGSIGARLASLGVALAVAIGLLALSAADRPAAAQAFNFSCSTSSLACSGSNSDMGTATLNPANGSLTLPLSGPQPGTVNGTLNLANGTFNGTFVGTPGTATLSCSGSQTSPNVVSGSCVAVQVSNSSPSSSSSQSSAINSLRGVANAITRGQVEVTEDILSERILDFSRAVARAQGGSTQTSDSSGYYRGISAGSADLKWGFWVDSSGTYLSNDSAAAKFDGYGLGELAGVDYLVANKWLLGFSGGYVRTDVRVKAISGTRLEDGEQFGPYLSYIASPHLSADLLFNYTRLSNSTTGLAGFDANRYTGAANINIFYDVGGFSLTGFFGYTYAFENPDSSAPGLIGGVPTSVHYGAVKVGGEAAYPMGNFEPYIPLTVEYETTSPKDGTGRGVVIIGAGARYRFTDTIKGGVELTSDEARSHSTNVVGAANLRVSF